MTRTELEQDSDFLGLIVMQNLLKKETFGAIAELHQVEIYMYNCKTNPGGCCDADGDGRQHPDRHQHRARLRAGQGRADHHQVVPHVG